MSLSCDFKKGGNKMTNNVTQLSSVRKKRKSDEIWYCREGWNGDSRDGQFINGEGYHYFEMKGDGHILNAFEYYETDDGEEKASIVPELIGINWFTFFGFEDEEILDILKEYQFRRVEEIAKKQK
jgi:hypothetical protein